MGNSSPQPEELRRAHPLAAALIERLGERRGARVLEVACGRGRNTAALRAAGLDVTALADDDLRVPTVTANARFDAALSTHGFFHGTDGAVERLVTDTLRALKSGAPFYATFASTADARFGHGERIGENVYAALSGDEAGVPHVYYDERRLRKLLDPQVTIDSLEEIDASAIVGRWAHAVMPHGTVHWFVRARRR